uniref:Uncharacterized protein n=1 Tax=Timspurckia oligopyrenoides TaxID=708627 RepID=A0A7S0ZFF7_9RHOD|mmetsp:Transcript_3193/g.5619  ORF Transcript_3193/g.5619 Transcript_3193/m.5619 type:complete len:208 (+) Transcript_3193:111-734(+)
MKGWDLFGYIRAEEEDAQSWNGWAFQSCDDASLELEEKITRFEKLNRDIRIASTYRDEILNEVLHLRKELGRLVIMKSILKSAANRCKNCDKLESEKENISKNSTLNCGENLSALLEKNTDAFDRAVKQRDRIVVERELISSKSLELQAERDLTKIQKSVPRLKWINNENIYGQDASLTVSYPQHLFGSLLIQQMGKMISRVTLELS